MQDVTFGDNSRHRTQSTVNTTLRTKVAKSVRSEVTKDRTGYMVMP